MSTLTGDEILTAGLADWRLLFQALHTRFRTGNFATGLRLVNQIGEAAEAMNHHPDVTLSYPHVGVTLFSHDASGVTERDVELARRISEFAAGAGVAAEPSAVSVIEVALDTADHAEIKPFWRAVLGYTDNPSSEDELRDPDGVRPTLWFQSTEPHDEPRQRFHLDIRVPHDVAEQRIAAALGAGGTLVSDDNAPAFVVLADADGNKVCVTTWQGRD